jgi:hypothetical protein
VYIQPYLGRMRGGNSTETTSLSWEIISQKLKQNLPPTHTEHIFYNPILSLKERIALEAFAAEGNVHAQHYVWWGYVKGVYGFPFDIEKAAVLKRFYKTMNNARVKKN